MHRDDIAKPNAQLCKYCVADGSTACYHHEVFNEALLGHLQAEKGDLCLQWPHLQNIPYKETFIRLGTQGIADSRNDPKHIEFEPHNHMEQVRYINMLQKELRLHNVPTVGLSLDALRFMLMELILIEERYLMLMVQGG